MISKKVRRALTLARVGCAALALLSAAPLNAAAAGYALCPPNKPMSQLLAMARTAVASGSDKADPCLRRQVPDAAPAIWDAILPMLKSDDDLTRRTGLRLLEWRRDADARHAAVLPLLRNMMVDPAAGAYRDRIAQQMLLHRERALFALPDFLDQARQGRRKDERDSPEEAYIELSKYSPTRIDTFTDLLDTPAGDGYLGELIAQQLCTQATGTASRAVPALERKLAHAASHRQFLPSAFMEAYLKLADSPRAAAFLMSMCPGDTRERIGSRLDGQDDLHGLEFELLAFLDDPTRAGDAAAILRGRKLNYTLPTGLVEQVTATLRSQLAAPSTVNMAVRTINVLGWNVPDAAPLLLSHYKEGAQASVVQRREALTALVVARGLDEAQLAYLATEALRAVRAAYPAPADSMAPADLLAVVNSVTALPAKIVPDMLEAFKLAHLPGKQSSWNRMTPFSAEQNTILEILGKTHSSAGATALANMLRHGPGQHASTLRER